MEAAALAIVAKAMARMDWVSAAVNEMDIVWLAGQGQCEPGALAPLKIGPRFNERKLQHLYTPPAFAGVMPGLVSGCCDLSNFCFARSSLANTFLRNLNFRGREAPSKETRSSSVATATGSQLAC